MGLFINVLIQYLFFLYLILKAQALLAFDSRAGLVWLIHVFKLTQKMNKSIFKPRLSFVLEPSSTFPGIWPFHWVIRFCSVKGFGVDCIQTFDPCMTTMGVSQSSAPTFLPKKYDLERRRTFTRRRKVRHYCFFTILVKHE